MEIHRPDAAPAHVHACPVHAPGKLDTWCYWEKDHDEAFKQEHRAKFDATPRG